MPHRLVFVIRLVFFEKNTDFRLHMHIVWYIMIVYGMNADKRMSA